jgi:hypothetical protein
MITPSGSCCGDAVGAVTNGIPSRGRTLAPCRSCGAAGAAVECRTLLHHLRPDLVDRIGEREYRFCDAPDCDTVYFSTDGEVTFGTADVRQSVGLKAVDDLAAQVCYCFGFTAGDLEADIRSGGPAAIPGRIRQLVKARACACEVRNPSGRCCLGEIARVVERLGAEERSSREVPTDEAGHLVTGGDRV